MKFRNMKIKFRNKKGSVTVAVLLSMMLIVTLSCAALSAAFASSARTEVKMAVRLAEESALAKYEKTLYDRFGILVRKDSPGVEATLRMVMEDNLEGSTHTSLASVDIEKRLRMTDENGKYFAKEVIEYQKAGIAPELLELLLGDEEEQKKRTNAAQVANELVACEDAFAEAAGALLKLLPLVEGIKADENGIERKTGRPVPVNDYCVKSLVNGEVTMMSTGITSSAVFQTVTGQAGTYVDALDCSSVCVDILSSDDPSVWKEEYILASDVLREAAISASEKCAEALKVTEEVQNLTARAQEKAENARSFLESKKDDLDLEVYEQMAEDLAELTGGSDGDEELEQVEEPGLCDCLEMQRQLRWQQGVLARIRTYSDGLKYPESKEEISQQLSFLHGFQEACSSIDNMRLTFNYSGIDFTKTGDGLSTFKKIFEELKSGVTGLVLDGKPVSERKLSVSDLADEYCNEETKSEAEKSYATGSSSGNFDAARENQETIVEAATEKALFNEYLCHFFNCYPAGDEAGEAASGAGKSTSESGEGVDGDSDGLLCYQLEFVLQGKKSDRENLNQTIMELSLIREGTNLVYLILNPAKREEALSLSVKLLGFSGNPVVIKAGQYLILSIWAYAEAIYDLRGLYNGKKICPVKTGANWHLQLSQIANPDYGTESEDEAGGVGYMTYLRGLILTRSEKKRNYRTMSLMEQYMIREGKESFRMRNYLYGFSGKAVFNWSSGGGPFEEAFSYDYG